MTSKAADRLTGIFFIIFAVLFYVVIIPDQTEQVEYGWVRPHTVPNVMSIIIGLCGLTLAIRPKDAIGIDPGSILRAGMFAGVMLAGVFLISRIGFEWASPVLALAIMLLLGERRPLWLGFGAVLLPALIWLTVAGLLDRQLP